MQLLDEDETEILCSTSGMLFHYSPRITVNIQTEYVLLNVVKSPCNRTKYNDTHTWIDIDYEDCNVAVEQTSQFIKRSAVVEARGFPPNDGIITKSKLGILSRYTVSCIYPQSQNVSTGDGFNGTATVEKIETDNVVSDTLNDFNISMGFYEDASFDVPIPSPQVELGEPMFLAVKNQDPDAQLKIVVDTCFASDSPNPNNRNVQYMFLHETCPYDQTYKLLLDDSSGFGFEIAAFVFIRLQSAVRYFSGKIFQW